MTDQPDHDTDEHVADEISERVRSVLAAAESAASAIRHEAEQEAQARRRAAEAERRRYLDEARAEANALLEARIARIGELSDALVDGAEQVLMQIEEAREARERLRSLVSSLSESAARLAAERAPQAPAAVEPPSAERSAAEPEPDPARPTPVERLRAAAATRGAVEQNGGTVEVPPAGGSDELLSARLVALQMAVAGSSREEVRDHLARSLGVSDPGAVLQDVFGPEPAA